MAASVMEPEGDFPAIKRDAQGKLLPGQRALNPSGLDRQKQRMLNQLTQLTPRAINRLSHLLDSADEKVAIVAVKEVLDRNLGKPKASLDVKVEASLSALHLQALEELAARARVAQAERAMIDVTPIATPMPSMVEAMDYSDDRG